MKASENLFYLFKVISFKNLLKLVCITLLSLNSSNLLAQDSAYTRYLMYSLTSEFMGGRGYVFKGDKRAADFIKYEFKHDSLVPLTKKYLQPFTFTVNTFPDDMLLTADNNKLQAGKDFIVDPASPGIKGTFDLFWITDTLLSFSETNLKNKMVVIDKSNYTLTDSKKRLNQWKHAKHDFAGIIFLEEKKLTWSVAQNQDSLFEITILKKSLDSSAKKITVDIDAKFVPIHKTQNVVGLLQGEVADTFIVCTAHYDHLGWMGKNVFFPGANDNASGTSMMLNLAKYYSQHKPKYSMLFIAFAGEEAGLVGSKFYTDNPLKPLSQIKFLINMDLMGTGDEGMMVVNATEYPQQFKLLDSINTEKKYLPKLGQRGKAANSDHYWFTEKGVPAFFFYTMGGITAYHDIYDRPETLPLTKYKEVYQLIIDFIAAL